MYDIINAQLCKCCIDAATIQKCVILKYWFTGFVV